MVQFERFKSRPRQICILCEMRTAKPSRHAKPVLKI
jgi:hypothetical protein